MSLAMLTIKQELRRFPFLSMYVVLYGAVWCCMVLHLAAFSAAELRYDFKVIARRIAGSSIYFSNSLIIYQVKAKEMTTMIPGLN